MSKNFDIFISYRRKETADKAEHLFSLLEMAGYKGQVSFDREKEDTGTEDTGTGTCHNEGIIIEQIEKYTTSHKNGTTQRILRIYK